MTTTDDVKQIHPEDDNKVDPEAIVISGLAGRFPNSDDIHQFRDNLFNKVDLVSDDARRWAPTHAEIPQRTGKINKVDKFDAGFFGVHQRQAHTMDPMCRMLLERTFEAVMDAGINPNELKGTDTGVFIGACFSESEKTSFYENLDPEKYGIMGCTRSMLAKRISYSFQLQGCSYITDTACSSSLFALEHAYRSISEGNCRMAIVGGCNLCLHPVVSLQFARLGVLSLDGACKSFDNAANGYARSEAISVVILQKAVDARRVYAEIIHSKTNCDGYKEQGITYPSGKVQKVLLEDFYQECGIDASGLTYVEAHGTGTKVGDPEELGTLDEIFCTNRNRPLLIGSVKSNIGHNEPISGLCSVVKVVLAFETGFIPPNIHYNSPRQGVEALETGRMKVVDIKTPLPDERGLIGINSFGFGGANSHLLLRWNKKIKQPCVDNLPRLICLSGRTEDALRYLMDNVQGQFDHELIGLLHKSFQANISGHNYRGYLVVSKQGTLVKSVQLHDEDTKPMQLIFGHLDECLNIGRHLFNLPMFAAHVKRVQNILKGKGYLKEQKLQDNNQLGAFILHSGLYDILKDLGIVPELCLGLDFSGKVAALYAKSLLSLEECLMEILAAKTSVATQELNENEKCLNNYNQVLIGKVKSKDNIELAKNKLVLIDEKYQDSILACLSGFGKLYEAGYNLSLDQLYPKIHWPVGRSTPMISPLLKWDHSKNWFVTVYKAEDKTKSGQRVIELSLRDDEWTFLKGHVIDGRCLFPATGYLVLIWETLARVVGKLTSDMKIVFEDVKFLRACTVPTKGLLELILMIQKGSGYFEVVEGGSAVVTGTIYEDLNIGNEWESLCTPEESADVSQILLEKDIYKEFRLRGYNYKGEFRALKMCNLATTMGKITWTGNWISLIDCMLQMQILSEDTRNLYVPTKISKILIDSSKHINTAKTYVKTPEDIPQVPVYFYKDLNIIRCGGIEVRGLWATSIAKRQQSEPVLESYKFSPYVQNDEQEVETVVRNFVQIALENEAIVNLKSLEVLDDLQESPLCVSTYVQKALEDQPIVKAQLIVLSNKELDFGPNITVENKKINTEFDCYIGIGHNLSLDLDLRMSFASVLKPKSFLISIESNLSDQRALQDFEVIASAPVNKCNKLLLYKQKDKFKKNENVQIVKVLDTLDLSWVDTLQTALKEDSKIVLWSNDPQSGILGFANCLRREPNISDKVSCFWLHKSAPEFSCSEPLYKKQLEKNVAINILDENNDWGSYRHFKLPETSSMVHVEHCYVNVTSRGDLSSLKWIQGPLTTKSLLHPEQILVHVYCAAINFRDIMTATGRIQADVVTRNRLEQDCIQGFEYAGRDAAGRRVMGMMTRNAMATLVPADVNLLWEVPEDWSLEQAVTIPAVYGTVLYGLVQRAQIKRGESILIHSATGGVGHAAIHVATYYKCNIFVTVGTEDKKRYIQEQFPHIKATHIGNSRDLSFLQMILKNTDHQGVDLVLNSLADEKLQVSVKCLKQGGRFVEIGKYDLAADSRLSMDLAAKEAVYHGVMLDGLFEADPIIKRSISDLISEGIHKKYIKALPTTCFDNGQLEEAFRYMATGKHMGKVVIKVRPEESEKVCVPKSDRFQAVARFYCSSEKVYVVNGGLGGFGLELIDWLVLRGARKIIVNSKRGLSSAYQKLRLQTWREYGTSIEIFKNNLATLEECQNLLVAAQQWAPVSAIFNLAVLLKDALFENQTTDDYTTVLDPKATATLNLDLCSRKMCPDLEHFVVFSSVSCGRGNAGQTNYGLANSIMERICEQRKLAGLPGLAIQWGAIGDVGLVADMQEENTELVIGGTLQQKIASCLDVLDGFLRQDEPIVGSMVVAEKKTGAGGANNIVDAVVNILGLRDLKTVSLHSSFPELGMDSMMAVEIKQTLEREYDVFLSPQDIRSMTFSRLQDIALQKTNERQDNVQDLPRGVKVLLRFIANEEDADIPMIHMVKEDDIQVMSSDEEELIDENQEEEEVKLFLIPGIEGMATLFDPFVKHIKVSTMCMQFCYTNPENTIVEMAKNQVELMKTQIKKRFCIVAHSFGSAVALEIVAQLEKLGYQGTLILIDGAPSFMKDLIRNQLVVTTEAEFQTSLLCSLMSVYLPFETIIKYKNQMLQCNTYEERIDCALAVAPKKLPHRSEYMKKVCIAAFKRMKAIYEYEPSFGTLESKVYLFRPNNSSVLDLELDYGLLGTVGRSVDVRFYDGNHVSILENREMAIDVNKIASNNSKSKKRDVAETIGKERITQQMLEHKKEVHAIY